MHTKQLDTRSYEFIPTFNSLTLTVWVGKVPNVRKFSVVKFIMFTEFKCPGCCSLVPKSRGFDCSCFIQRYIEIGGREYKFDIWFGAVTNQGKQFQSFPPYLLKFTQIRAFTWICASNNVDLK